MKKRIFHFSDFHIESVMDDNVKKNIDLLVSALKKQVNNDESTNYLVFSGDIVSAYRKVDEEDINYKNRIRSSYQNAGPVSIFSTN